MIHSRSLGRLGAVGMVGLLALTACGNSTKTGTGGLTGGASSAAGGATIKIGFQGPLSGDNAQLGINELNGVKLAVDQANKNNTYGFQVTLVQSDDVGDSAKAPAAAATLQQDPAILGVIGPSFSGPSKAVGASYDGVNLVLISPSATNAKLTTLGFKSFHRIVPPDSIEGKQAGDYLAKKATTTKKVFVIDDLSDYGKGAADAVEAELKAKGVASERQGVDAKTTDYSIIAQKVASSKDDAVFYGGYDAQAGQLAKALKAAGYSGITMTGNGGKSSVFVSTSGEAGNGWLFSCGCQDATTAAAAKDFLTAYKAMFNTDPSTYSPEAYDATNALLTAIKAAGASPTRKSVWDAVNAVDYKGITTEVKFQPDGEVAQQVVNLYKEENGKISGVGDIAQAS